MRYVEAAGGHRGHRAAHPQIAVFGRAGDVDGHQRRIGVGRPEPEDRQTCIRLVQPLSDAERGRRRSWALVATMNAVNATAAPLSKALECPQEPAVDISGLDKDYAPVMPDSLSMLTTPRGQRCRLRQDVSDQRIGERGLSGKLGHDS